MKQRLFSHFQPKANPREKRAMHDQDEDMDTDNFDFGLEPELDKIRNMI